MAVDKIDSLVQSAISDAQMRAQKHVGRDDDADAARKAAEKKIAEKKASLKSQVSQKETFQRGAGVQQKLQTILGGKAGQEPADALRGWEGNKPLQSRLTDAQKKLFHESIANNPQKGAKAAKAMDRISQQPSFEKAVAEPKVMGVIQEALLDSPGVEKPAAQLLSSRFMTDDKSDADVKRSFMKFGLQQAKKGGTDFKLGSVKHTGDMLNSLSAAGVPRGAQREAMHMVERNPSDLQAMKNVDSFAKNPGLEKMPSFAKGRATELLARSNGAPEVKSGFEKLMTDPKFQSQTANNQGRFFATIGSGNASEVRAMTDHSLRALQSNNFPARSGQVGQLLGKMASQARSGGADSVKTGELLKSTRSGGMPVPPKLMSSEGLDEEEANRVRSHNRGKIIQFYTQVQRSYEQSEKTLNSARYVEDVNKLQNLKEAPTLESSTLTPEEQSFVAERRRSVQDKFTAVKKLQRQRARELRGKRMPPAKRRARMAARRARGAQPKYFSPAAGRSGNASRVFAQATGTDGPRLPSTPQQAGRQQAASQAAASGGIDQQVAAALANMGSGPITAEKVGQVATTIANQVAAQVATQVTEQLLRGGGTEQPSAAAPRAEAQGQQGQVDGWGIPRTFQRDLGAAARQPVRQREAEPMDAGAQQPLESYTGRMLVKDPTQVRSLADVFGSSWKELSRAESALLKNLGWGQGAWDTRDNPGAKWPKAMATPFASLSPLQREAVGKLGIPPHDWDNKVQAFTMGKNA